MTIRWASDFLYRYRSPKSDFQPIQPEILRVTIPGKRLLLPPSRIILSLAQYLILSYTQTTGIASSIQLQIDIHDFRA